MHQTRSTSAVGWPQTNNAVMGFDAARRHSPPVIVGFSEDPAGIAALRVAADEARIRHSVLTVVHGLIGRERPAVYGPDRADEISRRQAMFSVLDRLNKVTPDCDNAEVRLVTTPVANELVTASARAQLVVVGVTSRSALAAVAFDSIARNVAREAHCPAMLVPAAAVPVPRLVVCGIDRSKGSARALRWAAREAELRGLTVLAVEATPDSGAPHADSELSEWVHGQHIDAETTIVCRAEESRHPARCLVATAASHQGLLVVGRHRRGDLGKRSTTALVAAQTSVTTVAVPAGMTVGRSERSELREGSRSLQLT